jgi:putative alpha-1,2-mannosidase
VNTGLEVVSDNFVYQNIGSFPTSQETFYDVYGPHFDSAELNVISVFENIFI